VTRAGKKEAYGEDGEGATKKIAAKPPQKAPKIARQRSFISEGKELEREKKKGRGEGLKTDPVKGMLTDYGKLGKGLHRTSPESPTRKRNRRKIITGQSKERSKKKSRPGSPQKKNNKPGIQYIL